MPRYDYHTSYFHKRSTARRIRVFAIAGVAVVLIVGSLIGADWLSRRFNNRAKQSQETAIQVQSSAISSFRSEYFEFQAPSQWREIYDERRSNRFVYRSFDGPIVKNEFVIEVGSPITKGLAETTSNRTLPVTIAENGSLKPANGVSDHCKTVYPDSAFALPKIVTMKDTSFLCNPNSSQFDVLVGEIGGDTSLTLSRPGGSPAEYFIEYKSFVVDPETQPLTQILSTFKTL